MSNGSKSTAEAAGIEAPELETDTGNRVVLDVETEVESGDQIDMDEDLGAEETFPIENQ